MTDKTESTFEEKARKNLTLSKKQMDKFIKQAGALRRNLRLRRQQQTERQNKCTHSK